MRHKPARSAGWWAAARRWSGCTGGIEEGNEAAAAMPLVPGVEPVGIVVDVLFHPAARREAHRCHRVDPRGIQDMAANLILLRREYLVALRLHEVSGRSSTFCRNSTAAARWSCAGRNARMCCGIVYATICETFDDSVAAGPANGFDDPSLCRSPRNRLGQEHQLCRP